MIPVNRCEPPESLLGKINAMLLVAEAFPSSPSVIETLRGISAALMALTAERDAARKEPEALAAAVQRTFDACCDEDASDIDADGLRAVLASCRAARGEPPA